MSRGIGADTVAVAGQLGEALSGLVGRHRSVVDLTADRPLKHGRVDEGGFGMRVSRRIAARAVLDEHAVDALAGDVRQLVLVDEGHFGVLLLWLIGEDAPEYRVATNAGTLQLEINELGALESGARAAGERSGPSLHSP